MEKGDVLSQDISRKSDSPSLASIITLNQPTRNNPSASCELHPKVQVSSVTAGCQDEP